MKESEAERIRDIEKERRKGERERNAKRIEVGRER